jgi:putative transposase
MGQASAKRGLERLGGSESTAQVSSQPTNNPTVGAVDSGAQTATQKLEVRALGTTSQQQVKRVCERVFARFGLPRSILVDNGTPFCGDGLLGLSRLNVWWRRLGIEVYFIDRGRPQQNGRLERLHRTLKAETTKPASAHLNAQQRRFNRWRQHYNVQRPHEAIAQRYPAELYRPSERAFPSSLLRIHYPARWVRRQVRGNGEIRLKGAHYFLTESLTGEVVGLQPQDNNHFRIYWNGLLLATLHPDSSQPIRLARYRKKFSARSAAWLAAEL